MLVPGAFPAAGHGAPTSYKLIALQKYWTGGEGWRGLKTVVDQAVILYCRLSNDLRRGLAAFCKAVPGCRVSVQWLVGHGTRQLQPQHGLHLALCFAAVNTQHPSAPGRRQRAPGRRAISNAYQACAVNPGPAARA
jgi:hypothetical protein